MNPAGLRPWIEKNGQAYINVNGVARPVSNATLRKDEWKQYDQAVLQAAQERLVGVMDLESRNLIYTIGNGLGKTVLEYEDTNDSQDAIVSMDGAARGLGDQVEYDLNYLPLPIIHKDYQINIRQLNASRTTGEAMDTTLAQRATRRVAHKLEEILFTGLSTYTYGGGTIYGYTDFPNRNTGSLTGNWDESAQDGEEIVQDVMNMKQASIDDRHYGPWVLYVPTNYEVTLDGDFKANSDKTIRQRILEISGIEAVKVSDKLTADNVLLVQMSSETVRLVRGLAITPVEWSVEGGMILKYKVMTIQVPQIRADQNDRCGIVHYT
jgi:uncharacterized linocin/CFP29 family protein